MCVVGNQLLEINGMFVVQNTYVHTFLDFSIVLRMYIKYHGVSGQSGNFAVGTVPYRSKIAIREIITHLRGLYEV